MDTATQLLMVASLPRGQAGGQSATKPEVNLERLVDAIVEEKKGKVEFGKGFKPTATTADGEFAAVSYTDSREALREVLRAAFRAGKTIQVKFFPDINWDDWNSTDSPDFDNDLECYRIKPEAPPIKVGDRLMIVGGDWQGDDPYHYFEKGEIVTVVELVMPVGEIIARNHLGNTQYIRSSDYERV